MDSNAGYVGDLYGTNGVDPEMTNDDYMADLDAVNISSRIKEGNNIIDVLSEYYVELENGQTNRAREFKCNIGEGDVNNGLYLLIREANINADFLEEHGITDNLEDRKKLIRCFFTSIINEYNYLYEE